VASAKTGFFASFSFKVPSKQHFDVGNSFFRAADRSIGLAARKA
jgi:hypothetical protein